MIDREVYMVAGVLCKRSTLWGLLSLILLFSYCRISLASDYRLASGQTLYVAVYSNIFSAPRKIPYNLATMLSIRNTDMAIAISVVAADYYDS